MPFVPGVNVAQVEVRGTKQDIPIENTLYFRSALDTTQSALNLLCSSLADYVVAEWLPELPASVTVNEIYAADLTSNEGMQAQSSLGLPAVGLLAGNPHPTSVTLSISFRTGMRGRTRRGRNYWLAFNEAETEGNQVSPAKTAALLAVYAGMVGPNAVASGWTWGVFSRQHNKAWREQGLFTPITGVVIVDNTVDSQRGRMK